MFCRIIALALAFLALPCWGAENAQFKELKFPPGAALAEILWDRPVKGGHVRERALASGTIKVPTDKSLDVILRAQSLEKMQYFEQLAGLPVTAFLAAKLDFTDQHLEHFKNYKNLSVLNLDDTLVTDKSLAIISQMTKLVSLRLSITGVEGTTMQELNKLKQLWILNLHGCSLKSGSLARISPLLPQLIELDLGSLNLSREDAALLSQATNLKQLCLRRNRNFDDSCIAYLSRMKCLRSLDVTDTAVTERSLTKLSQLPNLESVTVRARTFWLKAPRKLKFRVLDSEMTNSAGSDIFQPLH